MRKKHKCVRCSNETENLLCDKCMEQEKGLLRLNTITPKEPKEFKVVEPLGGQCKTCNVSTSTLTDGMCNVCKACDEKDDMVERPSHYNMGKIQPIDVIEDWKLDFRLASALKYIARAGRKDPDKTRQDLEKCIWYVQRYIDKELK